MWKVPQTCVFITFSCLLLISAQNTKAQVPSLQCSVYNLGSLVNKTVASFEVPPPDGRRPLTISTILDAALNSSSKNETALRLSIAEGCLDYLEFSLPEVALFLLNSSEFKQITFGEVLHGVFVTDVELVLRYMVVFKFYIQRFHLVGNETLLELALSNNLSVEAEPVLEILLKSLNDSNIRSLSLVFELSLPPYVDLLNRTTRELAAILAVEDRDELKTYTLLHLVKISFAGKDFFNNLQVTIRNIRASLHVTISDINDENVTSVLELVSAKIPRPVRYLSSYILGVVGHEVELLNVTLQEIADLANKTVVELETYKIYPQLVLFIASTRAKLAEINGETRKDIEVAIREILEAYNVTVEQLIDEFNLTAVQVRKLSPLRIELFCTRITLIRYTTNLHLTLAEVAVKVNKTEAELSYNLTVRDFHIVIRRLLIVRAFEVTSKMLGVSPGFLVNSLNITVPLYTLSMKQLDGFLTVTRHTVLDLHGVITRKSLAFVVRINGFSVTSVFKLTIEQFIIRVMHLSVHDFFALNGLNFGYSQKRVEILRKYRFAYLDRLFQIHEDIPKCTFSIFRQSVVWIINRIIFLVETDKDECKLDIDRCHRLSHCINLPGTYECHCPPQGYAGRYCEDINECRDRTANCPVNSYCVNSPGSYRCVCSTGYRHNPTNNTCDDVNECDSNNNNCFWGRLQCINTVGSYECRCPVGYRFNRSWLRCLDINECSENPSICSDIDATATCRDTSGSYECLCRKGFEAYYNNSVSPRVFINCTDVDECARGLKVCPPNSECINSIAGDYCRCLPGYQMRNGKCRAKRFVPFIPHLVRYIRRRTCEKVSLSSGFPYFGEIHKKLYICYNGLISLGKRYNRASPKRLKSLRQNIIAVFWANTDITFQSNIKYQVVERSTPESRKQLDNVSDVIRNCSGAKDFNATWMLIVTWERVSPYARFFFFNPYGSEQSTYQIALVTNGTSSHAIYSYEDGGMEWTRRLRRRCAVGYATKNREFSYEEADSFSEDIFSIDSKQFLVNGVNRRGFFCKSLDAPNKPIQLTNEQMCMNWYNGEPDPDTWSEELSDCPATGRLASRDNRYRNVRIRSRDINCYELRWPTRGSRASQQCCYYRRGRRRNAFVSDPPLAGRTYRRHYRDNRLRETSDIEPFQYCCSDAKSELCSLFYEKRPLTNAASVRVFPLTCNCRFFFFGCVCNRRPRRRRPFRRFFRAWFFGDPHISTLDALQYSFNGLGDYVLIRTQDNSLHLHGRTKRPLTSEGALSNATVFSGFVLRTNTSDTAQILFDDTLQGNLSITVVRRDGSCTNHTIEYFDDGRDFTEVSIERSSVNNKTVIVSFPSGFSIEVTPGIGLLQITVNANEDMMNNTQGLLGTFNGDKTDDLQYPNGTTISTDSPEEEIFHLGQKWKVPDGERLFVSSNCTLQNVFFDDAFVPFFLNLSAVDASIRALCGDNKECIYDVLTTGNKDLGKQTAGFEEENQNLVNEFANTPPEISGPTEVNVTLNQTIEFYITSKDPDNDTVTLDIDELPPGASFNSTSGHFEWTPTNATNITLEFIATDSKNVSTVFTVIVNMCQCENNGECDFTEFVGDSTGPFRVVGCNCSEPYEGTFCENETLNACADEPCYDNVTCATQTNPFGFQCGPCPAGLTGDGQNCFENDECENASVSRCNQTCVNTFGSFRCECRHGFITREEGRICEDINECQEAGNMRHNCTENASCMNLPGSFNCSCNSGFEGDPYLNCTDKDECTNGAALCSQECENTPGSFRCTCRSGFQLSANQATCEDINECITGHNCERSCENVLGSYRCRCPAGFELNADNITCKVAPGSACDNTNGECSQICVNRTGLVTCYCNPGYNLTSDGKLCTDINECMMGSHGCNQTCSNTVGSFMCGCHPGYRLARDNKSCEDVDECSNPSLNSCSQICENSVGSYRCSCVDGFSLQSDKTSCADIDECSSNSPICSDGSCVNIPGSFQCRCSIPLIYSRGRCRGKRVFSTSLTLMELNERPVLWREEFNNEQSAEFGFLARSVEREVNGFFGKGKFRSGFIRCKVRKFRRSSVIADIDLNFAENATDVTPEAVNNELPQSGQMGNLTYNSQTAKISDVDECADQTTHNCHDNANCENKEGSFVCACKDGYQGDGKTKCDAAPSPVDSDDSKKKKVAIVVCSVLFGVIILAFIVIAFCKARKKRYKGDFEEKSERSLRMTSRSASSDVQFQTDDKEKTGSYDVNPEEEPDSRSSQRSQVSTRMSGDYDFPDPFPSGKRTTYYDNPAVTEDSAL